MGAKHAKWFVKSAETTGWLRETELIPKTQGIVAAIKEVKFALTLFRRGKVPVPVPPHVAENVRESRALHDLVREQGVDGAAGIVQGERALATIERTDWGGARRDVGALAQVGRSVAQGCVRPDPPAALRTDRRCRNRELAGAAPAEQRRAVA